MSIRKTLAIVVLTGTCLISTVASAAQFRGVGYRQVQACIVAQNHARDWINQNIVQIHISGRDVDESTCSCLGDNESGWECTVNVQVR
jgi:hypothetical protein